MLSHPKSRSVFLLSKRPVPSPADHILEALRKATTAVSGEILAEQLGISRAAVFKHVEALRARGYDIASEHAQGYVLTATPDRLDATELGPHLTGGWRTIEWHAEIDSTQHRARELGRDGAGEGTVVIAEAQTAGRGRLGRTWHSPPGRNLYCSILLRPALVPGVVPQLALAVGLGVAEAIETLGLRPKLKWPNDVLVDGRKAVGILTEMEAELERVRLVIVGIGVNVNLDHGDLPPYLRDTATSLKMAAGRQIDRVGFTAALLAAVERSYRRFLDEGFPALRVDWDARDALRGRRVVRDVGGREVAGTVTGVDDDGALRLVDDHGVEQRVVAGEVAIAEA
jgi:BirA family biotin operon repressor/biotin-[acetyl-CoA-carboxylase] ligase